MININKGHFTYIICKNIQKLKISFGQMKRGL